MSESEGARGAREANDAARYRTESSDRATIILLLREIRDLLKPTEARSLAAREGQSFAALASAMRKMLPPELLQQVIDHLDPLTLFVEFLRQPPQVSLGSSAGATTPKEQRKNDDE